MAWPSVDLSRFWRLIGSGGVTSNAPSQIATRQHFAGVEAKPEQNKLDLDCSFTTAKLAIIHYIGIPYSGIAYVKVDLFPPQSTGTCWARLQALEL